MPLWLQGVLELGQAALILLLLVSLPIAATWLTGGFAAVDAAGAARLGGQAWLVVHGVPLELAGKAGGTFSAVPFGLTLLPFLLAWRAGRRLARASYTDQLWQALAGSLAAYAALGAAAGYLSATDAAAASPAAAAVIPLAAAGAGIVTGARREAGAFSRLVGVDAAAWVARTSQHSRWAGSYAWAVLRAGFVAFTAALGLAALLLAGALAAHWADIAAVYERLEPGVAGVVAISVIQLGFLPNLAVWALAWTSGAGFQLGAGSSLTPFAAVAGPLPALPVLGALPAGALDYGLTALGLPVLAGALAGWWFFREGENHFDEWLAIRLRQRWFTAGVSTLCLGGFIGLAAALPAGAAAQLSRASLGVGRLTELGPDPLRTMLWLGIEVAAGAVIGHIAAPLFHRESRDLHEGRRES
jgi:hypothetical protein